MGRGPGRRAGRLRAGPRTESPAPLDPITAVGVLCVLAEIALWDGRLPDGRAAVADGLAILAAPRSPTGSPGSAAPDWPSRRPPPDRARQARPDGEYQAVRERAAGLLDRIRSAISAPDVVLTPP